KQLKPDRFEDIIAMVALYRPGPMSNIPTYIARKHGNETPDYLHPMLKDILRETYGVIIYQEQVMQIAQVMAGYSLGKADVLRRAMGKKDKAAMAQQQAEFVTGAVENGVKKEDAAYIFELVDKFAGYGFNKSHAAAYALVAYHTAYLKANYCEEFLAASMTLDLANTEKLAVFAAEAHVNGIEVRPPCINASAVAFSVEPPADETAKRPIRYALAALKNVGEGAVQTIVDARTAEGPFADASDFSRRLNAKAVNKRSLEMLASAGAFDCVGLGRAEAHDNAEQMLALSNRLANNAETGIEDLFGGGNGGGPATLDLKSTKSWSPMERLDREFSAIGFYLSGHPLDEYRSVLTREKIVTQAEFMEAARAGSKAGRIAGIVVGARERKSQKGNAFAFASFTDTSGPFEAIVFSELLHQSRGLLKAGTPVVVGVEADVDGDSVRLRAASVEALEDVAKRTVETLKVQLDPVVFANGGSAEALAALQAILRPGKGRVRLEMSLFDRAERIDFDLAGKYETSPAVRGELSTLPGVLDVATA
ncbi:MAG: DNA polymerase III subunit alpha, partial [Pseudomonadota bacterium]